MATIHHLNNRLLQKIFTCLDNDTRKVCRKVCRKWRLHNSKGWRALTKLIYCIIPPEQQPSISYLPYGLEAENSHIECLGSLLQLYNGSLVNLHVRTTYQTASIPSEIPNWICTLFNTHKDLHTVGIDYDENSELIRLIKCIPSINIHNLLFDFNDHTIDSDTASNILLDIIRHAPQLVSLNLINPPILTIRQVNEYCDLRALYIIGGVMHPTLDIINLKNLKMLSIYACHTVDDDFVISSIKNCQKLHCVEISHCDDVKSLGMNEVASLPRLNFLISSYMDMNILNKLSSMSEVYGKFDINVFGSYTCILEFLKRSPTLKKFNFGYEHSNSLVKDLAAGLRIPAELSNFRMLFYQHWELYFNTD